MGDKLLLSLTREDEQELAYLSSALGFPRQAAVLYAVRVISACIREGLIDDVPPCTLHEQASPLCSTGTGGKLIEFPGRKVK